MRYQLICQFHAITHLNTANLEFERRNYIFKIYFVSLLSTVILQRFSSRYL